MNLLPYTLTKTTFRQEQFLFSGEDAIDISAGRRGRRLEADKITPASDHTEVLRMMVDEMSRISSELEALKHAPVVVAVNRESS